MAAKKRGRPKQSTKKSSGATPHKSGCPVDAPELLDNMERGLEQVASEAPELAKEAKVSSAFRNGLFLSMKSINKDKVFFLVFTFQGGVSIFFGGGNVRKQALRM